MPHKIVLDEVLHATPQSMSTSQKIFHANYCTSIHSFFSLSVFCVQIVCVCLLLDMFGSAAVYVTAWMRV